jgi:nucleotide-binding universal stress UspA family protein
MFYKSILVHVDDSTRAEERMRLAARLASQSDAHLIGVATSGISGVTYGALPLGADAPGMALYLESLSDRADSALERFEKIVRETGVTSYEKRRSEDEPGTAIALHGRYADLVVLGQHDPDDLSVNTSVDFPAYVVMMCGRPVLIVPYAATVRELGKRILVAWNESAEAAKAVANALALLERAEIVEVAVMFEPQMRFANEGEPGADIALYLARHGIKADVSSEATSLDAGNALLNLAASLGSDLLVMGCYGHSRLREILLGGTTRTILQSMTIPVLMSH